jgi:hypothetical protein
MLLVSLVVASGFVSAVVAFLIVPNYLVDDARFKDAGTKPSIEARRLKARDDVRVAGIQLVGALALIVGGALTWRTVWLTREGQITDRLAEAIGHLREDESSVGVRVGAIYALGRVARDSRCDHPVVMALLAEHLRTLHSAVDKDDVPKDLPELRNADPEVRAVAMVLRARRARWDSKEYRLDLSGVDFREAPFQGVDLRGADLRKANFRGAHLSHADLSGAWLEEATLKSASLQRAKMRRTRLNGANLRTAHVERASMRSAILEDVIWELTELYGANLRGATGLIAKDRDPARMLWNSRTKWPRTMK